MWLYMNTAWLTVRDIPPHWMHSWNHVCICVDTIAGKISLSLNGESSLSFNSSELKEDRPTDLQGKLYIGLSEDDFSGQQQFRGEVANFNIFSVNKCISAHISNMSSNSCTYSGDIVNSESEWDEVGMIRVENKDNGDICINKKTDIVAIPVGINFDMASKLCVKLNGSITEAKDDNDKTQIISMFEAMNNSCKGIWTPFIDKEKEGEFKSSVTGKLASYLPWKEGEPNGGNKENYVIIHPKDKSYHDVDKNYPFCTTCDIHKSTVFTLIGVCKDSYFGIIFFILTKFYKMKQP